MRDRRARGWALRFLSWVGVLWTVLLVARPADAYTWMIRHKYSGCTPCHADPSGAGLLTPYGRALGEAALRTRYGVPPPEEDSPVARFLFGVPTPDWLLLGGSLRSGVLIHRAPSAASMDTRFLGMEYDLRAQLTLRRFRVYGSLGYMNEGAQPTLLTHHTSSAGVLENNLVSREHWVGVDLDEDRTMLLRAGRINLPFGIRHNEHAFFTRSTGTTRTNLNESQQHGIAFSYNGQVVRGELMALLGNYQLNPDSLRERGYAGFLEYAINEWANVGVSSMVTYARYDYLSGQPNTVRQLHGAFTRIVPKEPVVLLVEADAMLTTSGKSALQTAGTSGGIVSTAQVDYEPTQGVHLAVTGELMVQKGVVLDPKSPGTTVQSYAGWLSALWFFAPHADLRVDFVAYSIMNSAVGYYFLPQAHVYL